jgi:hypothetical protein
MGGNQWPSFAVVTGGALPFRCDHTQIQLILDPDAELSLDDVLPLAVPSQSRKIASRTGPAPKGSSLSPSVCDRPETRN